MKHTCACGQTTTSRASLLPLSQLRQQLQCTPAIPLRTRSIIVRKDRRRVVPKATSFVEVADQLNTYLPHLLNPEVWPSFTQHMLTLGYEPVVLPCSSMNCGDMVHRSTLDPVLRYEQNGGVTPQGLAILGLALAYLLATPGVLVGAVDFYILAPLQRVLDSRVYTKDDIRLGKKLATGGFGTVYKGDLESDNGSGPTSIIVKKAKEFGEAEVWMNERMMRVAPNMVAEFITAFEEGSGRPDDPLWLVWKYEGDNSLYDFIISKDFPYNLEKLLVGRELRLPKGPERKSVTLRIVMCQLLETLKACHSTGIVHRDIKPQNCIVSVAEKRLKIIDWGAAADLRVGINYVPNEFLLDPRYAPPQQYIMTPQTPRAPPTPIAAALSPILWRLNNPDRFDMYSVGVMMMQMVFPGLRTDNQLITFNRRFKEEFNYDLAAWRAYHEARGTKDLMEGFALLDLDDGAGWELLGSLVQYQPGDRVPAALALNHRWLSQRSVVDNVKALAAQLNLAADKLLDDLGQEWLEEAFARSGTEKVGGLTEAWLSTELGLNKPAPPKGNASNTIVWWRQRQSDFDNKKAQKAIRDFTAQWTRLRRSAARTLSKRDVYNGRSNVRVIVKNNTGKVNNNGKVNGKANRNLNGKLIINDSNGDGNGNGKVVKNVEKLISFISADRR